MHDPRTLLDPATDAVRKLARRGYRLDLRMLRELADRRGAAIKDLDEARAEANHLAQKRGVNTARGRALRATISEGQQRVRNAEEALRAFLLDIPNLPENLCPDCSTFQARRAGIRTRTEAGQKSFVATLNGSGLPIGRTLAALLEQHQQTDGSVTLPDALVPYVGYKHINADGTTSH